MEGQLGGKMSAMVGEWTSEDLRQECMGLAQEKQQDGVTGENVGHA
jgi:hypothetical protein